MAKKDPTDLTVEEKLKALYQLQTTLSAIDEKRALRGELPLEVQDLEDDIAGLTTRIEKIQTDIEQFDSAIDQKQHEQPLIIGNRCKLPLDYLNLPAFHEDIIAVDSHQNDDENREYCLQDAFHHRPSRQGDNAIFSMFRGYHA